MTLQDRDKRAVAGLGVVLALILIYRWASSDPNTTPVVSAAESIPLSERQLGKLRQVAAAVPGKEQVLSQVLSELAIRERGVIVADTAPQAQAQILQVIRRVGRAQSPPLDFRGIEIGQVRALGEHYGEALVSVSFDAQIDQLVNLMAELTAQKELIATQEMRIGQAHPKQKTMPVRLTVSGVVKKEFVPAKKRAF